tara:strand:- start:728 stop:913 length:186 start_codon:yes stop_codon:yes gene_type:complete
MTTRHIKLSPAEYQRLMYEAADNLTIFAKFQLLADEIPMQSPRVSAAWNLFATAMLEEYSK